MGFERFTEPARHVLVVAWEEAKLMRHAHIGTEHLLVGLADEPEVAALGLSGERARAEVVRLVGLGDVEYAEPDGDVVQIPFTAAVEAALQEALGEAMRLGHGEVQPGHVLLAVLKQRDGVARRMLVAAGAVPSEFREAVTRRLEGAPQPASMSVAQDAHALLAILERDGPVAAWLRERGVDDAAVRQML